MDYSRQERIEELRIPDVVTVLGGGGLGTWVAYGFAQLFIQNCIDCACMGKNGSLCALF
jgi:hypothetical protein